MILSPICVPEYTNAPLQASQVDFALTIFLNRA
jgi:hypothetical protein